MTLLAFVTRLAIAVLVFASSAVFIWFLFDVRKVLESDTAAPPKRDGRGEG